MSLVVVGQRLRAPGALARTLLLALAIIAGLLAMHALNAHQTATGHGSVVVASVPGHADHPAPMSAPTVHEGARSAEHPMAWMACVLALLGVAIAVVVTVGRWFAGSRAHLLRATRGRWSLVAHALPPPSLAVLCIRRT